MALSRAQILSKTDLPRRTVDVPEWGGEVTVRTLKASEKDGYEVWREKQSEKEPGTPVAIRARLVALAACDDRGEPLFGPDDAAQLGELSAPALARVYDAVLVLNAMDGESQETIRKNSKAPPASAGSTASPAS